MRLRLGLSYRGLCFMCLLCRVVGVAGFEAFSIIFS